MHDPGTDKLPLQAKGAPVPTEEDVQALEDFIARAGGLDAARKLLEALKDYQERERDAA